MENFEKSIYYISYIFRETMYNIGSKKEKQGYVQKQKILLFIKEIITDMKGNLQKNNKK